MASFKQLPTIVAGVVSLAPLVFAAPGTSAPPSMMLGRQTTAFVNIFSKEGCNDGDFVAALGINSEPIAGPQNCVGHNSAGEIGETQQEDGGYHVWIQPTQEALFGGSGQVIVRSPVAVDVENCGVAVNTISTEGCFGTVLSDTFFLQGCLKSDDRCVPHLKVADDRLFARADPYCFSNSQTTVLATDQTQIVSGVITCSSPDGCSQAITYTQSITNSVSVEATAGFKELFSVTMGYEWSEETSTSTTTTFNVPAGGNGVITFTPILTCNEGTATSCDGIRDGNLKFCASKKLPDGSMQGDLAFLNQD